MSRPDLPPPPDLPAPEELFDQAAALAEHLRRSGVEFLPSADASQVEAIRSAWRTEESPSAEPSVAATESAITSGMTGSASATVAEGVPAAASTQRATTPAVPPSAASVSAADSGGGAIVGSGEPYPGELMPAADRQASLSALAADVSQCQRCPSLASCRTNTVFGEGAPAPRVAFFGEGPGADEDRTGRPFVGRAGQLLTKMIEACSFRREDVYILNTVKCRPPGNRNPEPEEIDQCRPYFEQQLSILRPEYIVCLGAVSSQALLRSKLSVGRLRGKFHPYFESKVLVTYHPAYLLRNPAAKKAAWDDLQLMLRDAGIDPQANRR